MILKALVALSLVGTSMLATSANAAPNVYIAPNQEYTKQSMTMDRALQLTTGKLHITRQDVPSTAIAAYQLFVRACVPSVRNDRYAKSLIVEKTGDLTILNFQCDDKDDFSTKPNTVQFIATLDERNIIVDLQILRFTEKSTKRINVKEDSSSEILLEVGAGTLIDGLLSRNDEHAENGSKIINSVAGSLVAVSGAALAYHNFNISKKQAYWIGVASGVVASLLKGAYDTYSAKETLDATDRVSAAPGALPSNIDVRFQISF
ncbi:hypothetical protein [Bdellovibrio sp. HCB209]|uniref:hypothetical protein n=1 Tax=Bdellovibrio sp. HCB209 TaxID=3394354 RepID=UPI0039B69C09